MLAWDPEGQELLRLVVDELGFGQVGRAFWLDDRQLIRSREFQVDVRLIRERGVMVTCAEEIEHRLEWTVDNSALCDRVVGRFRRVAGAAPGVGETAAGAGGRARASDSLKPLDRLLGRWTSKGWLEPEAGAPRVALQGVQEHRTILGGHVLVEEVTGWEVGASGVPGHSATTNSTRSLPASSTSGPRPAGSSRARVAGLCPRACQAGLRQTWCLCSPGAAEASPSWPGRGLSLTKMDPCAGLPIRRLALRSRDRRFSSLTTATDGLRLCGNLGTQPEHTGARGVDTPGPEAFQVSTIARATPSDPAPDTGRAHPVVR